MIGCNQNVLTMLNMTPDQFIGKTYEELAEIGHWPDGLAQMLKADDLRVMNTGIPIIAHEDPPIPHAGGGFSNFLTSRVPLLNKDGSVEGIAGISADVTLLKAARTKAEVANKAKTEFIANMSHDIRTPLSGVVGMSQLLVDSLQNKEQKQYAEWLHISGEQLLNLLNDILDMISAEHIDDKSLGIESFDLRQCIQDIAALERPTIHLKGIDLRVEIDKNIPQYINSDRNKVHRIILNLLGNAIKFTEHGYVSIKAWLVSLDNKQATIRFAVTDTGIGIAEDQQDKVFDRFHRATPSYKGLYAGHGVGLHIAQSYANLLGGHIQLTSSLGQGTEFTFELNFQVPDNVELPLPQFEERAPILAIPPSPTPLNTPDNLKISPSSDTHSPHILLVEDNHMALKVAETIAIRASCRVSSAITGEQALEMAKNTVFDLILTDIGLPGISGNEFTKIFREWEATNHKKPVPIVGLTAHAKTTAEKDSLLSGMNNIFTKPITSTLMQGILTKYFYAQETHSIDTPVEMQAISTLGIDLPETAEELFEMDAFPFLDIQLAISSIGNEAIVREILQLMMSEDMQKDITNLEKAHKAGDWATVEKLAHKMKGGAVYIGTVKMKYACQYLERYQKAGHTQLLEPLYQQLISIVLETKNHIKQWLSQE